MSARGLFNRFDDTWIVDGVRTPMVAYCGAFADVSPTDLGIMVAREVLRRTGIAASVVDSVIAGSVAPGDFDQFYLARHIGLYAGMRLERFAQIRAPRAATGARRSPCSTAPSGASFCLGRFGIEVTHARLSNVRRHRDLARARAASAAVGPGRQRRLGARDQR